MTLTRVEDVSRLAWAHVPSAWSHSSHYEPIVERVLSAALDAAESSGGAAWRIFDEGLLSSKREGNDMTTFTAEDFAKARFAEHEFWGVAARAFPGSNCPWFLPHADEHRSDDEMVISGWSPVHEAGPLSVDALRTAWENAEVPTEDTPVREGDVVIFPVAGGYCVRPSWGDLPIAGTRVLSRAPQREPWQDLADVLGRYDLSAIECEGAGELARDLYADGVRVTGGDDA